MNLLIWCVDAIYDDVIYEYDLMPLWSCNLEEDTVSNTSAQVDVAKQAIRKTHLLYLKDLIG